MKLQILTGGGLLDVRRKDWSYYSIYTIELGLPGISTLEVLVAQPTLLLLYSLLGEMALVGPVKQRRIRPGMSGLISLSPGGKSMIRLTATSTRLQIIELNREHALSMISQEGVEVPEQLVRASKDIFLFNESKTTLRDRVLLHELDNPEGDGLDAKQRSARLVLLLYRMISRTEYAESGDFSQFRPDQLEKLFLAKSMLDKIFDRQVLSRELEQAALLNAKTLKIGFKELTGNTIHNYHRIRRLEESLRLLLETDLSIAEIAIRIGYTDHSSFSQQFKAHFGKTASEMRKQRK